MTPVTAEQLATMKGQVEHLRAAAAYQRMPNGYFNFIGELFSGAVDSIERSVAEVERVRRECAMHVIAARKVHHLAVTLADGDRLAALRALQDDGELHCAIHDCLAGTCAQEWIDEQLAVERGQRADNVERLREALTKAAEQFEFYAQEHRRKADVLSGDRVIHTAAAQAFATDARRDTLAKAETNERFAAMCRAALPEEPAT